MADANQREETGCDRGRDMLIEPDDDIVPILAAARRVDVESLRRAVEEIIVMLLI
jgi:hypothetical protein